MLKSNICRMVFVLIISFFIPGCDSNKKTESTSNEIRHVSVRQEWFPNANFAGEVLAAQKFDTKNGLDITVEAGADDIDPVKLVLSGKNEFGIVGADKILLANEKGANLVVIGVLNYNSPTVFIAKLDKKITTPKSFEGKKVGVLTGTATEYVYRTLLKKASVDRTKIKEVEAPFDLKTFILGDYEVRPAFAYDEPVTLDIQHFKYSIIKPEDYGVNFMGTVYFTTRQRIIEEPKMVQKFINSMIEGWSATILNPKEAITALKAYDKKIDTTRELLSLQKALPYFSGKNGRLLVSDATHWNEMGQSLRNLGLLKGSISSSSVDSSFVKNYYKLKRL